MSGKPAIWYSWSNSGNYPAGADPWDNQPLAVAPAGTYFTPNFNLAAEELNYLFGNTRANGQALLDWAGADPGVSWRGQWVPSAISNNGTGTTYDGGMVAACWVGSPSSQANLGNQWAVAVQSTSAQSNATDIYLGGGHDGGNYWVGQMTGATSCPGLGTGYCALVPDPAVSTTFWVAAQSATNNFSVVQLINGAPTTRVNITTAGALAHISGAMTTTAGMVFFGKIGAVSGDCKVHYSLNSVTWNTFAIGGTGNSTARIFSCVSFPDTSGKQIAIVMPNSARNDGYAYATTSSPGTWTLEAAGNTGGTGQWGANELVAGLCYGQDATGLAFFVLLADGVASATSIWRSTDGLTWSKVANGPAGVNYFTPSGLAAIGNLFVAPVELNTLDTGTADLVWISGDGGVHWHLAPVTLDKSLSGVTGTPIHATVIGQGHNRTDGSNPVGGAQQFFLFNNIRARFSDASGLPSGHIN